MSNYNQPQPPPQAAYPAPGTAELQGQGGYTAPPPPMKDGDQYPPADTQSRGDGFWKGCCAALCCCCLLDACF